MTAREIKKTLKTFLCSELIGDPAYPLADDEPLISGGLIDSFALARVGVFIEDAFGVNIPDVDLTADDFDTLDQIAAAILRYRR